MPPRDRFLQDNGTLRNRPGIQDPQALASLEAELAIARTEELRAQAGPPATHGAFDLSHLKAIHGHIFQDVYAWAGTTRGELTTIEGETFRPEPLLFKGTSAFLPANQVERTLNGLFGELARQDQLRGLSREAFAQQAADAFVRLNTAHPFREGNGRTQREFISQLARQAGHPLDFRVVSQERMIVASYDGTRGDPGTMRRLFDEISDRGRTALLHEAVGILDREGIAWREMYFASARPDHDYTGRLAVYNPTVFVMASDGDVIVGQGRDLSDEARASGGQTITVQTSAYPQEHQPH